MAAGALERLQQAPARLLPVARQVRGSQLGCRSPACCTGSPAASSGTPSPVGVVTPPGGLGEAGPVARVARVGEHMGVAGDPRRTLGEPAGRGGGEPRPTEGQRDQSPLVDGEGEGVGPPHQREAA